MTRKGITYTVVVYSSIVIQINWDQDGSENRIVPDNQTCKIFYIYNYRKLNLKLQNFNLKLVIKKLL